MLRDPALIPLSRQHQHALALCVRIERATLPDGADLTAWQSEIDQHFAHEIQYHFAAEEAVVFPVASRFENLRALVEELLAEHQQLRQAFARAHARQLGSAQLRDFAIRLSSHIRKEERQLFEQMQSLLGSDEMSAIGSKLEEALQPVDASCILPSAATRPRPKSED